MCITNVYAMGDFYDLKEAFYVALRKWERRAAIKRLWLIPMLIASAVAAVAVYFNREVPSLFFSCFTAVCVFCILLFFRGFWYLVIESIALELPDTSIHLTLPDSIEKNDLVKLWELNYMNGRDWFTAFVSTDIACVIIPHIRLWGTILNSVPCKIEVIKEKDQYMVLIQTEGDSWKEAVDEMNVALETYDGSDLIIRVGFDSINVAVNDPELSPLTVVTWEVPQ